MTEAQGDTLAKELEPEFSDLKSLLEAAKNSEFSLSTGFTEEKKDFERIDSLFDLIKSEESSQEGAPSVNESDEESDSSEVQNIEKSDDLENIENLNDIEELGDKNFISDIDNIDGDLDSELSQHDEPNEPSEKIDLYSTLSNDEATDADNDNQNLEALEKQSEDENLDDEENKSGEPVFENELEKNAYHAGYKAALDEFENSMSMERNSIENLMETMFLVGEKFQDQLEETIKIKILQLADDLIGSKMQEFQDSYLEKIEIAAADILEDNTNIKLELNHSDFAILEANAKLKNLSFEVIEKSDLRRGEFRIISNKSGFQQKYSQ